jgi:hypothetical protein
MTDLTARGRFMEEIQETFYEAIDIIKNKNNDYANSADPFHNFKSVVQDGLSVEQGMTVRMRDKMARIGNLLNRPPSVKDESLRDTCIDLANYAIILAVWLEWDEE